MAKFIASMTYELSGDTSATAEKLLRAELVGRRWKDRCKDRLMPRSTVWMFRDGSDDTTTSSIHDDCAEDLSQAANAVAKAGQPITVLRLWIQVAGGGTFGLSPLFYPESERDKLDIVARLEK